MQFAAMLARRNYNRHLKNYELISSRQTSITHLLLTSSAAILFGFKLWADEYKMPRQQQARSVSGHCKTTTATLNSLVQ